MPEKITAYRCKFKCGRPPNITKASIAKHEENCFYNPDRKACKICWFFEYENGPKICIRDSFFPDFKPPEMYTKIGICYDCQGFSRNGPE